ncbi:glycosyltransferase [Candidatus Kaiserbacteria bacterium]|nr:glycosyltransferase [Candidatus Kaiserbacteria bacterium]
MSSTHPKPLTALDIVISIHNQEQLIPRVLAGILNNTTTPFNLILVFDGCTDGSQKISEQFLKDNKVTLLKNLIIATAENVYELRANNIGFRLAREEYLITLQDDVVIEEKGWERRFTYPLRAFDDIFAVSSKAAFNVKQGDTEGAPCYYDYAARAFLSLPRDTFTIRNIINRGPIAFRNDILKKLGYLDELFAPGQFDEADLVLRATWLYGMKCGAFWINYRSDSSWGKTRTAPGVMSASSTIQRNARLFFSRHQKLLTAAGGVLEDRIIREKDIDYITRDPFLKRNYIRLQAANRFFFWYVSRTFVRIVARAQRMLHRLFKKILGRG